MWLSPGNMELEPCSFSVVICKHLVSICCIWVMDFITAADEGVVCKTNETITHIFFHVFIHVQSPIFLISKNLGDLHTWKIIRRNRERKDYHFSWERGTNIYWTKCHVLPFKVFARLSMGSVKPILQMRKPSEIICPRSMANKWGHDLNFILLNSA